MFEFMNLCLDMQTKMIEAQQRGMEATRESMQQAGKMADTSDAFQKASRANLAAWDKWVSLWTPKT